LCDGFGPIISWLSETTELLRIHHGSTNGKGSGLGVQGSGFRWSRIPIRDHSADDSHRHSRRWRTDAEWIRRGMWPRRDSGPSGEMANECGEDSASTGGPEGILGRAGRWLTNAERIPRARAALKGFRTERQGLITSCPRKAVGMAPGLVHKLQRGRELRAAGTGRATPERKCQEFGFSP